MTNQQKAEACGEYVRYGLDALTDYRYIGIAGLIIGSFLEEQDLVVRGARRAGHWGRLALADLDPTCRACNRLAVRNGWCIRCWVSVSDGQHGVIE